MLKKLIDTITAVKELIDFFRRKGLAAAEAIPCAEVGKE